MSSRRNTLRSQLIGRLGLINGVAPYEVAITGVLSTRPLIQNVHPPCLIVVDDTESREYTTLSQFTATLTAQVYAVTEVRDETERITQLDSLVADVKRAIDGAPDLGYPEYGVMARVMGDEINRGEEGSDIAEAKITVEIQYRDKRGEP